MNGYQFRHNIIDKKRKIIHVVKRVLQIAARQMDLLKPQQDTNGVMLMFLLQIDEIQFGDIKQRLENGISNNSLENELRTVVGFTTSTSKESLTVPANQMSIELFKSSDNDTIFSICVCCLDCLDYLGCPCRCDRFSGTDEKNDGGHGDDGHGDGEKNAKSRSKNQRGRRRTMSRLQSIGTQEEDTNVSQHGANSVTIVGYGHVVPAASPEIRSPMSSSRETTCDLTSRIQRNGDDVTYIDNDIELSQLTLTNLGTTLDNDDVNNNNNDNNNRNNINIVNGYNEWNVGERLEETRC